jgi:hypothetical protein
MRSDLNIGPIPSVGTSGVGRAEAATIDWTFSAEQVPLSNSPFPQDVEVVAGAGAVCGNGRESVTQMAQTADGCSRRSDKETVGQKLQKGVQQTPKLQIPKPKGQSV